MQRKIDDMKEGVKEEIDGALQDFMAKLMATRGNDV